MTDHRHSNAAAGLAEAAGYFHEACMLYECEDLDPDDHMAVLDRAFTGSDCLDFAHTVQTMTGWPGVIARWATPDGQIGLHALTAAPDGRMFDITGYMTTTDLIRRYLGRRGQRAGVEIDLAAAPAWAQDALAPAEVDEHGLSRWLALIAGVIRALPRDPFDTPEFQALAARPLAGADIPLPAIDEAIPVPNA